MAEKAAGPKRKSSTNGLAQLIYDGLLEEITTGKLRPGEPLSRRRIADRYGCSYTPVIEAMVRLEHAGLIEAESSQMARVRSQSIETIRGIYILREAYETQAIRLACDEARPREVDELYELAEAVDRRAQVCEETDYEDDEGPLLNWRFHLRISEISRCPFLTQELERIELLKRLRANWIYIPKLADPPRFHAELVDTIRDRDPLAADAAMRAHVRKGFEKEARAYQMKIHP
jgi:DNA-binding GntR family transcriptional regulator